MKIIALHGKAGAGKDTFADRLVDRHGFVKRGFADPLYEEVAEAFRVGVGWLRDRDVKERDQDLLRLVRCHDEGFTAWAKSRDFDLMVTRSPRWILQQWGTGYRRGQSDTYWLERMGDFVAQLTVPARVVIPDCRFLNEGQWVLRNLGQIVKIVRPGVAAVTSHVSEIPLPEDMIARTVHNTGSISYLHAVADSAIRGAERIGASGG
jgi:hypothetical protein